MIFLFKQSTYFLESHAIFLKKKNSNFFFRISKRIALYPTSLKLVHCLGRYPKREQSIVSTFNDEDKVINRFPFFNDYKILLAVVVSPFIGSRCLLLHLDLVIDVHG